MKKLAYISKTVCSYSNHVSSKTGLTKLRHMSKFSSTCSIKCSNIDYETFFLPFFYKKFRNVIHFISLHKFGLGSYAKSKVSLVHRHANHWLNSVESSKHRTSWGTMFWWFYAVQSAIHAAEHQWNLWLGITSMTKLPQQNGSHLQIQ